MIPSTFIDLIFIAVLLGSLYNAYRIGRKEGRREEALRRRQQTVAPPAGNGPDEQVECVHFLGGDPDDL